MSHLTAVTEPVQAISNTIGRPVGLCEDPAELDVLWPNDRPMSNSTDFFLLAFPALISIINPLGGAFIFLGATASLPEDLRGALARWVAIHTFLILNASLWIGAYVLGFFGISLPGLRVAGGIVISLTAWKILYADEEPSRHHPLHIEGARDASRAAFFPLTMPVTAGPGTISVAIALGTNRSRGAGHLALFALEATIVTVLLSAIVYALYRYADVCRA